MRTTRTFEGVFVEGRGGEGRGAAEPEGAAERNIRYQAMAYAFITVTIASTQAPRIVYYLSNQTHVHRPFQPSDPRTIRTSRPIKTIKYVYGKFQVLHRKQRRWVSARKP